MNNAVKKIISHKKIALSSAVLLATVLATNIVFAHSLSQPMNVSINDSGSIRIAGTVSAISGSSISVLSWGGTWSVDASNAMILPGKTTNLSEIKIGDTVVVWGTASTTGLSIVAKKIQNKSIKTFTGEISNFNATAGTFTLSVADIGDLTVVTSGDTKVFINGNLSSFSSLSNGMKVNVSGHLNASTKTITASIIKAPALKKESDDDEQGHGKGHALGHLKKAKAFGFFKNKDKDD